MEMDSTSSESSSLPWPQQLRLKLKEVVMGLVKGKEYATQLQALVHKSTIDGVDGCRLAEELAQRVLRSFTDSIAKLSLCNRPPPRELLLSPNQIGDPDYYAAAAAEDRACADDDLNFQGAVDDDEGSKKKRPSEVKGRRGCYKRRREAQSWVEFSPTMEDGFAWRKYGQKTILNSKHPRCYFRCTHKYDPDLLCRAIKQVQRVDDGEKLVYQTTYFGLHTCEDHRSRAPQIISEDVFETSSSNMICFRGGGKDTPAPPPAGGASSKLPQSSSAPPPVVKQESNKGGERTESDLTDLSSIDSSKNIMWQDNNNPVYYPKIAPFHDQEVASSSGFVSDASIKSFMGPFADYPFEEDGFLLE